MIITANLMSVFMGGGFKSVLMKKGVIHVDEPYPFHILLNKSIQTRYE